jgi:hypothetical protein
MGHNAKCCCLAVILLCTAAIGAPGPQADLTDKEVYPLEKQEDVWWAGIRDLCELGGAELTATAGGPVILQRDLRGEAVRGLRFRIEAFADQLMGKGPIEIKVGDDTYKLETGSVKLEMNGERVWDLIHEPRAINGVGCASLEDLARILGFTVGGEVDGQPTIAKDDQTYRLVQGQPSGFHVVPVPDVEVFDEDLARPLIIERPNQELGPGAFSVAPRPAAKDHVELNGALYLRAPLPAWVPDQSGMRGGTFLYGPVIRDQFRVNGQPADLLYLSIVELKQQPPAVVLGPGDGFRVFPNPPGVGHQGGGMGGAFEPNPLLESEEGDE